MHTDSKRAFIDSLYYGVGKQSELKLAKVWTDEKTGEKKWSKHKDYLAAQADEAFMAEVNNRTILPNEVVLDFDLKKEETPEQLKQRYEAALATLKAESYKYQAYFTGSRGYHIHLFFSSELAQLPPDQRKRVKEFFISKFGCDLQKAGSNVMIALENCPHWKTGQPKTLLEPNPGENSATKIIAKYETMVKESQERERKQRKTQEDEKEEIKVSFFEAENGQLYEQVSGLQFAAYDPLSKKVSYLDGISDYGVVPISDELEAKKAVLLPSEASDFGTVQELLDEIEAYINRYCDLSQNFVKFASWYVLLTAVADKINTVPYLRFLGDTGTGKSRAVDIIGRICYKPLLATACITPAPIYRMINQWQGTLILEEADIRESDETNEVIKILNAGFERGKPVLRSTKDNPDKIQVLPVFGPKVFATRRRFEDAALEARCLTEIMKETKRKDIPPLLPKAAFEEQKLIRNKLLMFRFKYRHTIDTDAILQIDFGNLEPRSKQVAASFAVIFANLPEVLDEFKAMMAKRQGELIETRSLTFEGLVIGALVACLQSHVTNVTNVAHVTITAADVAEEMPTEKGQKPNARTIGKILRTLGLTTELQRVDGKVKRIIKLENEILLTLIKRYIPLDEQEEAVTCVTSVTSVTCVREPKRKWDERLLVHHHCQHCKTGTPCNFDQARDMILCRACFEAVQLPTIEEAIADV